MIVRDFPAKLARAAEVLGCRTQKELLAELLTVNPRTSFDPVRSYKWLQGKGTPRNLGIYQDLADALGLGQSGEALRTCSLETFEAMLDARWAARAPAPEEASDLAYLDGVYMLYMRSFAQFPTPKIFYCPFVISTDPARTTTARIDMLLAGLVTRYSGSVTPAGRLATTVLTSDTQGAKLLVWFADPGTRSPVIPGLIGGQVSFIAAAVPKCTRVALIRVKGDDPELTSTSSFCAADEASLTWCLERSGYASAGSAGIARHLLAYLNQEGDGISVSVPVEDAQRLMAAAVRAWRLYESPAT